MNFGRCNIIMYENQNTQNKDICTHKSLKIAKSTKPRPIKQFVLDVENVYKIN